ncbi:MAG: DNA internalization-related competence protein ComEC/Rec2 [Coriobacteriales bacterium]
MLLPVIAFWFGIVVGEEAAWRRLLDDPPAVVSGGTTVVVPVLVGVVSITVLLAAWLAARRLLRRCAPMAAACLTALILGAVIGFLCWGHAHEESNALEESAGSYELCIEGDPVGSAYGSYSLATLRAEGHVARVRVMWRDAEDILPVGASARVKGSFSPIDPSDKTRRMHRSLVAGRFKPSSIGDVGWAPTLQGVFGRVRQPCIDRLDAIGGDGAAILRGILLGDRSAVSGTGLDDAFRATGLAHMLAVSGTHLTVVALLVTWMLQQAGVSRRWSIVLLSATAIAYLVFTALQPSAFRACIMAVVASSAWFAGRRRSSIAGLVLATAGLLVLDPANAFAVGFQLSVLGVAGLCVFLPLAIWWMERLTPRRLHAVAQPLALTLVAQAATSPVAIPAFAMLSLVGPLANLIVSPAIAVLLGGGLVSLVISLIAPALGQFLLVAMSALADLLAQAITVMFHLPVVAAAVDAELPAALVGGAAAAIALWMLWPLPGKCAVRTATAAAALALMLIVVLMPVAGGANIVVMDIGQGDAILLSNGRSQVLVDTGPRDTDLRAALGRQGIRHLDAVVISHFDDDHCGALGALQSLVTVDHVVMAEGLVESASHDEKAAGVIATATGLCGTEGIVEVSAGDSIRMTDRMTLSIIWPDAPVAESSNENSVCLLLSFDADRDGAAEHTALLTGDAEHAELDAMVDAGLGDIEALKVGHHGSGDAVDAAALAALRPEIALVSVGAGNSYGHPNSETLSLLESAGAAVYRTDLDGDIRLFFDSSGTVVRCSG